MAKQGIANKYIPCNGYSELIVSSDKLGTVVFKVDSEDVPMLKEYHWCLSLKRDKFYLYNYRGPHGSRTISILHRLVMNAPSGLVVDHVNHDTLDNRKSNLRLCTTRENLWNTPAVNTKNKTSGLRNISWNKNANKWAVAVMKNRKPIHIGYFADLEDAKIAAEQARKRHFNV